MSWDDVSELPQVSPEEWGAVIAYDGWSKRPATSQLFFHWGGSPVTDSAAKGGKKAEAAQLRAWERYHRKKGWRGLAYDYAIGNSGTLYRVRGSSQSGGTSGDVDNDGLSNNSEGEAIVFIVGQGQSVSKKAKATAAKLVRAFGYDELYGHKEAKGTKTACPGPELMALVEEFRSGTDSETEPESGGKTVAVSVKVLKRGDRGDNVAALQALCGTKGAPLKPDGIFGPMTERAVRTIQSNGGLTIDGVVGKQTWSHLLGV